MQSQRTFCRDKPKNRPVKGAADRKQRRRDAYANDETNRERQKAKSREQYARVGKVTLPREITARGTRREVTFEGAPRPITIETFSITEAASALGKSLSTFRRWLREDLLPEPYLEETSTGYHYYSRGELSVIAEVLAAHGEHFVAVCRRHTEVWHTIQQRISAYRAESL